MLTVKQVLCTLAHDERIHSAAFIAPKIVVCTGETNSIVLWNVANGEKQTEIKAECLKARVKDMVLVDAPDLDWPYLVLATTTGSIQVWNLNDKDVVAPIAETRITGGSRVTCLSACMTNETSDLPNEEQVEPEPQPAVAEMTQAPPVARPAKVIVQYDQDDSKKRKGKSGSSSRQDNRRKRYRKAIKSFQKL